MQILKIFVIRSGRAIRREKRLGAGRPTERKSGIGFLKDFEVLNEKQDFSPNFGQLRGFFAKRLELSSQKPIQIVDYKLLKL